MRRFILSYLLLTLSLLCFSENIRIVSLAASVTRNLYAIGAQEKIVGCTRFCLTDPKDSIPVVADAINAHMEQIVALRPSIVIASGLTPPKVLDGLNRMGIQTIRLTEPRNFEEICEQCIVLGTLSGRKEQAQTLVKRSKERLNAMKDKQPKRSAPKVFMEIGNSPLYTVLPGSFMHDYIHQAGGRNIAEGIDHAIVSKEFVLLHNPDVLLVVGMGTIGEEEIERWKEIGGLSAVQRNKVYLLSQEICSPTPWTFVDAVAEIMTLFY